ncbi:MAG: transporter ATP-binding protein [Candidatus Eremiobacteraeota bacterium]|nr:transporter ATP-binding protein [Candidatus Eremiobacteraeota bacterium]
MIETKALVAGRRTPLVDVPDMLLAPGSLVAIIGPNGVGKSTLLATLAGRIAPLAGTVFVNDASVHALSARRRALRLAYLPADDVTGEPMIVREVVLQGRLAHRPWWLTRSRREDLDEVDRALDVMGLVALAARDTATLSTGEQQRVWIAMALAQSTPAIMLDEPTSHLDVRNAAALLAGLRRSAEGGKLVVVVLHDLNLAAAFAHRIVLLGAGSARAAGTPAEVLTPEHLSACYGVPMQVVEHAPGALLIAPVFQREEAFA